MKPHSIGWKIHDYDKRIKAGARYYKLIHGALDVIEEAVKIGVNQFNENDAPNAMQFKHDWAVVNADIISLLSSCQDNIEYMSEEKHKLEESEHDAV